MKKVMTKLLAVGGIGLLMLSACKKDGTLVTSNGGKAGTLTASTSNLVLDKTKLTDPTLVINFNFTAPNYGYSAAVTNTLQIDAASDNWKNPTSATLGIKTYTQGYSTSDFNTLLLKLNLAGGVAAQVNVRVMHTISADVAPIYSNVISLTVTPYNLASWVYVPGAYEGWSNPGPQEDSLLSATDNGIYTGIINLSAGNNQFLVLPVKGDWTNKWATNSPGVNPPGTTVTYPVTYNGSNNFYAPTAAGYYLITFNINNNTISIVPADYYSITGSAVQGWGVDTPMKFINDGNNNWVATGVPMTAAEYKFRQDDQWTNSWGPGSATGTAVSSGATGDGNFQIGTAGNYNLTFTMPPTPYGSPILTTTTYTAAKQ
jgi:hypothetical protein